MASQLKQELEREMDDIRKIQKEVGKIESMRQDFLLKKNENELVKEEIDLMSEDSKIYKLIGPALVPQTLTDAQTNVNKRLEFIDHELRRLEHLREGFLKKNEEKQNKILKMQRDLSAKPS
mmetsp:Transcript_3385/g.6977  ORF Transcript_3385/g.6977 Transcript_3385/m.6977 type:complete len:121 (+) Transcript_3385:2453-2815(+)